jgi:hypothetical protein
MQAGSDTVLIPTTVATPHVKSLLDEWQREWSDESASARSPVAAAVDLNLKRQQAPPRVETNTHGSMSTQVTQCAEQNCAASATPKGKSNEMATLSPTAEPARQNSRRSASVSFAATDVAATSAPNRTALAVRAEGDVADQNQPRPMPSVGSASQANTRSASNLGTR